jgi:Rad3-related DNA helicase
MLSPSIAEGFSFDDDLARWQIIAKVPYPYLGDRQVAAKMKQDRDWYVLQTVMTVLQACGRIVRSDIDHGTTYILDSDFIRLFEDNTKFFPKWFKDAFKFYD